MKIYKLSKVLKKAQVLTPEEYLTFCTQIEHIVDDRRKVTDNSSLIVINVPDTIFWLDDIYMDSGRLINMTEPGAYVELHDVFAVNTKTGAVWALYHFMGWKSSEGVLTIPAPTAEALHPIVVELAQKKKEQDLAFRRQQMTPYQIACEELHKLNKNQLIEKCRELEIPVQDNWLTPGFGKSRLIIEAILDKLDLPDELSEDQIAHVFD